MQHRWIPVVVSILGWISISAPAARGAVIPFDTKGIYTSQGQNNAGFNAGPGNTLTGTNLIGFHSFFVYDLSSISVPIVTAQLRLFHPFNGYNSADPSETMTMFDVTSSNIPRLRDTTATSTRTDVYNDLGSGNTYGSRDFTAADGTFPGTTVLINLNTPSLLTDINAARGGFFAMGGAITTLSGAQKEFVLGFTGNDSEATLLINEPLPEPGAMGIVLIGAMVVQRRRRAK
jgi:hypothetical protein